MTIDYRKPYRIDYRKRPAGAAAGVSLEKVADRAPGLVDLYKSAAVSLVKNQVSGERAAVYLVLDRSGSMRPFYRDGSVQHLAEQTLALAANLDDDGVVPVVFFSTDIDGTADISLDAYRDRIGPLHESMGHMGRTNYHLAMQAVIDHYEACGATDPAFVVFQTDGSPTSKAAAEHVLCTSARLPIFWQFVGFGEDEFRFLRRLDDLPVPGRRVVDNAGFFAAGPKPAALSDAELYDRLLEEFPQWLAAVRAAGILRD
ncbi:vWA domain-containing protein [Actinacidiphila epipremni]|uniref:VWA domain-containing protein n=1 Tax=Actinacidiphila epipremni TaxID=2053013 RepID=A0ABX0ZTB9_9ACTN|nr:VWA domain-containing protein [Actinacidiphila epipremni]NJP47170.1 VWA domain-containing protein [Actinacidiphila epipremni]